jgi:hypothetical protein
MMFPQEEYMNVLSKERLLALDVKKDLIVQ